MRRPLPLGESVPRAPNFAYLRNHEPMPLVVGRNDSAIKTRASLLGYTRSSGM